jgi:hypothetical protein
VSNPLKDATRAIPYEEEQRNLLQFTRLDLFLVCGVACGLGFALLSRALLGATSSVLSEHNIAGGRHRLYCQLDKESNFSLRHYRATLSDCRDLVSAFRCAHRSHGAACRVAIRSGGYWDSVSAGMEVRETFIVRFREGRVQPQ